MFVITKSNHIFVFWPTKNSHTQNGNMPKKLQKNLNIFLKNKNEIYLYKYSYKTCHQKQLNK